jgi:Carbohydrate-selective porin, OprB family
MQLESMHCNGSFTGLDLYLPLWRECRGGKFKRTVCDSRASYLRGARDQFFKGALQRSQQPCPQQGPRDHGRYALRGRTRLAGRRTLGHPRAERIIETYYKLVVVSHTDFTFDYQWVTDPAYNADRGPVSIVAVRLHAQF